MIKVEVTRRIHIPGRGWKSDLNFSNEKMLAIMGAGFSIMEEYVDYNHNSLYVVVDDDIQAALFKLTYL